MQQSTNEYGMISNMALTNKKKKYTIHNKMFEINNCTLEPDLTDIWACHGIMAVFILHKLILQRQMHSRPVWFLDGPFVYFHTSWAFPGCLCDKYHNLMSWLISSYVVCKREQYLKRPQLHTGFFTVLQKFAICLQLFVYLFWFNVAFNNFSVISRRCLVVTGSSLLTFIVLPHWSIMPQTLYMIPHPVTLSWH